MRRCNAQKYNERLKNIRNVVIPFESKDCSHVYHLYVILVDFEKLKKSRNQVMKELRDYKIGTQVLYIPVHLQPYYKKKYGFKNGDFKLSENYYQHCLSIPMFPSLTKDEVDYIIKIINTIISK